MITRIANFVDGIEGLWFLLTIFVGIGVLSYVGFAWGVYLFIHGRFILLAVYSFLGLVSVAAALGRMPIALILVFGGSMVCGVALLSGYAHVLLP
jgi:hypothetical protein